MDFSFLSHGTYKYAPGMKRNVQHVQVIIHTPSQWMVSTQKLKVEFPVLALGWFKVGHLQFNVYMDVIEMQHD